VLLGGILTDTIGWEWIFFLNVPVGLAVIAAAPCCSGRAAVRWAIGGSTWPAPGR